MSGHGTSTSSEIKRGNGSFHLFERVGHDINARCSNPRERIRP